MKALLLLLLPLPLTPTSEGNSSCADSLFSFNHTEAAHLSNFKKIAEDVGKLEEKYKDCIKKTPWLDYTQDTVDACVGENYDTVELDVDFEKYKIQAQGEAKLRESMFEFCYNVTHDEKQLQGCDLMEKDAIDLMWMELNFAESIATNKVKYLFEFAKLDEQIYKRLIEELTSLYQNIKELTAETNNHRDVLVVRLKTYIDERSKEVIEKAEDLRANPKPHKRTQTIQITQSVSDPNISFNLHLLPKPMLLNGEAKFYDEDDSGVNPYVEDIRRAQPLLFPAFENAPHPKITDALWNVDRAKQAIGFGKKDIL